MKNRFAIGLIGAGRIARHHLHALQQISEVHVVGIADSLWEAAQNTAEEFGIPKVYDDYRELLALPELDAVIISVPNFIHCQVSIDALYAGKHVLCEKPMAVNAIDANRMVQAQKETGKKLMIALNNRFRRDVQLIKQYAENGEFGEIYNAKSGWMRRAGIPGWGGWFTNREQSGGGPLIDLGIHMLDLALYLMGNVKPISVVGSTYMKFGSTDRKDLRSTTIANQDGFFNVEDLATAFIRLDNGATLTLDVSWAANIEKDRVFVDLMGTNGGASIDREEGVSIFSERYGQLVNEFPLVKYHDLEARVDMHRHFLSCIEHNREPICTPEQGMFINLILDAIYESSRTGRQVEIKVPDLIKN
ncbi:Gfo/Idh/MocA family protein [Ammoniphilus sp. 3BR4]|uniref:Gfo/Idh/MocA family protein n=1 Tax=Ammoniphilus sp. 3BR4 TaxID=3158265 RepID=UPI003467D820